MGGVIISWLFFFANLNKIRVAETGKRGQGKDKEGWEKWPRNEKKSSMQIRRRFAQGGKKRNCKEKLYCEEGGGWCGLVAGGMKLVNWKFSDSPRAVSA